MRKTLLSLSLALLACSTSAQSPDDVRNWELGGYVKNLQSLYVIQGIPTTLIDNLVHNRLNFRWYPSDALTVRVEMRNRIFVGDFVALNPMFGTQIEQANNDRFDLSVHLVDKPTWLINSTIDRAYVQYNAGNLEVLAGRQRINWGINTVWNPNDIFNAFSFTDFDYEERPGSDAVLVRYYTGTSSSIEVASNMAGTWQGRVMAALFKWNAWQYDFQVLSGWAAGDFVVGGGWAGNIKDAGFKGEWTWFMPDRQEVDQALALTVGFDYILANGLYLNLGYLYNSTGTTEGTLGDLFNFQLSARNLYPFRHALFFQQSYPISSLLNAAVAWIYSPVAAKPLFLNPSLTISISQNWDLDLVMQLSWNRDGGKYVSPFNAGFLRMKCSF